MRPFGYIVLGFSLLVYSHSVQAAEKSQYENLSKQQQSIVDITLDTFKRHHLFFLPEMSTATKLTAATARADSDDEADHDHGTEGAEDYKDEHLDIKIARATPDKDGKYQTPTIQLTPDRMYTYKELYAVVVGKKEVVVDVTAVEEDKPERVPASPEPDFVKDLAKRISGTVVSPGKISLP